MASNSDIYLSEAETEVQDECQQEETEQVEISIENSPEEKEVCDALDENLMEEEKRSEKDEDEEQMCEEPEMDEETRENDSSEWKSEENVGKGEFRIEDEIENDEEEKRLDEEVVNLTEKAEICADEDGKMSSEDGAALESRSKSDESALQESFGGDADSEAGGETEETEVEIDERTQPEGRSSRDTSPTPCPPESPSESVPAMSMASSPDMKNENDSGDVMSASSVDVKNELMLKLDGEINKDALFQQRFFILASNYDEMIKMKDEYKAENERLRLENMQMKMENTRIYNEKLESKERENHKLHQTVDYLKRELTETQSKLRTANDDYKTLCLSYEQKILRLVQNLSVAEETLADTVFKLREQELVRSKQERENRRQCERLQKEKNDLMELALSGDRNNFYLS